MSPPATTTITQGRRQLGYGVSKFVKASLTWKTDRGDDAGSRQRLHVLPNVFPFHQFPPNVTNPDGPIEISIPFFIHCNRDSVFTPNRTDKVIFYLLLRFVDVTPEKWQEPSLEYTTIKLDRFFLAHSSNGA